jgi:hypothetical protein
VNREANSANGDFQENAQLAAPQDVANTQQEEEHLANHALQQLGCAVFVCSFVPDGRRHRMTAIARDGRVERLHENDDGSWFTTRESLPTLTRKRIAHYAAAFQSRRDDEVLRSVLSRQSGDDGLGGKLSENRVTATGKKVFRPAAIFLEIRATAPVTARVPLSIDIRAAAIRRRLASRSRGHRDLTAYGTRGPCRTRKQMPWDGLCP